MADLAQGAVVFDIGGVLIDWNPRHLYRKIFSDEREMEYFLSSVCTPAWNAQLDRGIAFAEAIPPLVERFPAYTDEIEAYRSRWP